MNNENNYTLIVYKPYSSDFCRGCHMASYHADYQIFIYLTRAELIDKWAAFESYETQINEVSYECTVFINGHFVGGDYSEKGSNCPEYDTDEYDEFEEKISAPLDAIFQEIQQEVSLKSQEIVANRAKAKEEAAKLKLQREAESKKQQDLKTLAALQAQYPDNVK